MPGYPTLKLAWIASSATSKILNLTILEFYCPQQICGETRLAGIIGRFDAK